jgi:hypothetical protein
LCMSFADDLGGAASLTEAQRALVRQAASLSARSESMQAAQVRGEEVNPEEQTRLANVLTKTLSRLGAANKRRK